MENLITKDEDFIGTPIAVHINRCRDDKYFYNWNSNMKGWVRMEEIPEKLNRMYKNPKP